MCSGKDLKPPTSDLRSRVDGELQFGLFAVVDAESLHQEGGEAGAGAAAERVEHQKTLRHSGDRVSSGTNSEKHCGPRWGDRLFEEITANGAVNRDRNSHWVNNEWNICWNELGSCRKAENSIT